MSSTFLWLRYFAFALFIVFHSVICIVAALNLGGLAPDTPRFPEVDSYLIVLGALGLVVVFPVIFVELIRKNAFIARVAVEITWVGLLWVMNLSGAAATTAILPGTHCSLDDRQLCASAQVLQVFTWLSTLTLLSYLLGLVISAVHHSQEDGRVWQSGVRDYRWFMQRTPMQEPSPGAPTFSYGKLADTQELQGPTPAIYAQQMGLARTYSIEPLRIETTVERPIPPVPAAAAPSGTWSHPTTSDPPRVIRPLPPTSSSSGPYSLYPQHLQAATGELPAASARPNVRSPPPAGSWPRSNPQEPLRRKPRPAPPAASSSFNAPPAPVPAPPEPEMGERGAQVTSLSSAARSRPSGPRTPSSHRPRPPPLDLSRVSSHGIPGR